jgi:hypothetical protein
MQGSRAEKDFTREPVMIKMLEIQLQERHWFSLSSITSPSWMMNSLKKTEADSEENLEERKISE